MVRNWGRMVGNWGRMVGNWGWVVGNWGRMMGNWGGVIGKWGRMGVRCRVKGCFWRMDRLGVMVRVNIRVMWGNGMD